MKLVAGNYGPRRGLDQANLLLELRLLSREKKPTSPGPLRVLSTSAYSSTDLPAWPDCLSMSHPKFNFSNPSESASQMTQTPQYGHCIHSER